MKAPARRLVLHRRALGFFPTPFMPLPALSRHLGGPAIVIKRDDQTGLALGGNKTRKLEYLMGDAMARGADVVVTGGAAQSNHCRQTAAAAAACGMGCHLALGGEAPEAMNGNLLLDRLLGAELHWCGEHRKGEDIPEICRQLGERGLTPYVIPYGGSNATGTVGYAEAMRELVLQLGSEVNAITHMVFASSSGGTHAGLLLGRRMYGVAAEVVGICIDKGETGEVPLGDHILQLAGQAVDRLGLNQAFSRADLILLDEYTGGGYGVIGDAEREAISLCARLEGILLDPVYTGRAMAGLIDLIRRREFSAGDTILFWHTGGSPALFASPGDLVG
ncbi:MAG: D-cysteine desulfhydrase family protein [Desulfobulbaceae bacterium]|nr:MAG: D-cysteine desulfhydrase family protein [Desulfobulbaceae bacterium]